MVTQILKDRHEQRFPAEYDEGHVAWLRKQMENSFVFKAQMMAECIDFLDVKGDELHPIGRGGVEYMLRRLRSIPERLPLLKASDWDRSDDPELANEECREFDVSLGLVKQMALDLGMSEKFKQTVDVHLEKIRKGHVTRRIFMPWILLVNEGFLEEKRLLGSGVESSQTRTKEVYENFKKVVQEYEDN